MSNIQDLLAQILAARYGSEVRQSIHDAIETCYEDGHAGAIDLQAREDISTLQSGKQDKNDNSLDTTDKTVVGAINELKSGKVATYIGQIVVSNTVTTLSDAIINAIGQVDSLYGNDEHIIFELSWTGTGVYMVKLCKRAYLIYFEAVSNLGSYYGRYDSNAQTMVLNEVQTKIKTKTYTGTTDQYGRITTDLSLTNVAMVNVISNSAGHICEQYFSNTGNLGIKVLNSVDMNAVTNTSVTLTIRYASV